MRRIIILDNLRLKIYISTIVIVFSINISAQKFTKAEVLSDLEYLKSSLEETHISLYAYTAKNEFEANYIKVRKGVEKDSFSVLEASRVFQKVVSKVNNGHTRIPFPVASYIKYFQEGGTVFPLEVALENNKVLIRKNWSNNENILIGSEIKSINGKPIDVILEEIYPQVSAERLYFKKAQIEGFTLPRYYWYTFGEEKSFTIEIIQNNQSSVFKLDAVKALDDYETKRIDIIKQDWKLEFPSASTAYLRPGKFSGDLDNYQKFIDSSFNEINSKKFKNLIIDLRNHSGGDDPFGDYLVSYIADKPFKWTSKYELKTSAQLKTHIRQTKDTTATFWKSALDHEDGEIYPFDFGYYQPQPKAKRYHGHVYVLVNRLSFSQSTVTAAQIQDYNFGTIVGEETGEYPNLYASIYNYPLPKTGISVDVSKGRMLRVSGVDNMKGLIPDILIKDHLLDENDEILNALLKRLNQ